MRSTVVVGVLAGACVLGVPGVALADGGGWGSGGWSPEPSPQATGWDSPSPRTAETAAPAHVSTPELRTRTATTACSTDSGLPAPVAGTVADTVGTVQDTVTGQTGPLPVDLHGTLGSTLGCSTSTATPSTSPSPSPSDSASPAPTGDTNGSGLAAPVDPTGLADAAPAAPVVGSAHFTG